MGEREQEQLVRKWGRFINSMRRLEKDWENFVEGVANLPREEVQSLPLQVQKGLSMFGKSKFNVMLPRFVDFIRAFGGLEYLEVPKEEEKEEEENG